MRLPRTIDLRGERVRVRRPDTAFKATNAQALADNESARKSLWHPRTKGNDVKSVWGRISTAKREPRVAKGAK